MKSKPIIGWDIGGAHVKAALLNPEGRVEKVRLVACQLWLGLEQLRIAMNEVMRSFLPDDYIHAITMTGELADLFTDRIDGVRQILQTVQEIFPGQKLACYAGPKGFVTGKGLSDRDCLNIASMNWYASSTLAARHCSEGLFIDVGSTTTDILVLRQGVIQQGMTDYQRLLSSELVYTGIIRTAVMAVAQKGRFRGRTMRLMAEYFATMADVYRLTGELNEEHDRTETADGGVKNREGSARRLSRMVGYEYNESEMAIWESFAGNLRQQQIDCIIEACSEQIHRFSLPPRFTLIGAGVGRFLCQDIALQLNACYQDFRQIIPLVHDEMLIDVADCAPAAAVACLAFEQGQRTSGIHASYMSDVIRLIS